MINALVEAHEVEMVQGDPVAVDVPRDDGTTQRIHRCPACQIAVFSEYVRPELLFVRVGTLDDPAAVEPGAHIYTRSKVPWLTLPADVPAFDGYYDSKTLWPADSLARRRAVLNQDG